MVIGSNERSWPVDVPFDHFGQKHPTGSGQIGQNSGFPRFELVWARTFERKVIETWLYAQMKGLVVCELRVEIF